MQLGTSLLLKEDYHFLKKGDKILYLKPCTDSGYYCIESVVLDKHYSLLMKEFGASNLLDAFEKFKENSITPMDIEQFSFLFTTIKPKITDVCIIEDLLKEQKRLKKRLEYTNNLISLWHKNE
jgi:hypothetical protein